MTGTAPTNCPGQTPAETASDTPHIRITADHACPHTCPHASKSGTKMKNSSSQPYGEQEPLMGIPGFGELSPRRTAKTQNRRSDLSRTGRGQRGRSSSGHPGPDLSLSPPLSRGDRSGTAPAPPRNHNPKTSPCNPTCITCGRPEDRGTCTTCATICAHNEGPHTTGICITRTRAQAKRITSPITGRTIVLVPNCPFCGAAHIHANIPNPHRTSLCGRSYVLTEQTGTS